VPRLAASATPGFDSSLIFFTGFGVYYSDGLESSFRLREPNGVFTPEISSIFVILIQIRSRRSDRHLILTDSILRPCRL
jgi:hypothetical protein